MENDLDLAKNARSLWSQLEPYTASHDAYGRVSADFKDLLDVCQWFISTIKSKEHKTLSEAELEDFLIDVDVNFIQHALFHLKSLELELPLMLEEFPGGQEDDDPHESGRAR